MKENNEMNYSSIPPVNGELITDNVILGEYISNNSRSKFITRVYNIVFFQLFITTLTMGLFIKIPVLHEFSTSILARNLLFLSFWILVMINCMFVCLYESFNRSPFKEIFLVLFTICISYTLGITSMYYTSNTLLLAGISTLGSVGGLTLYAYQTKYDFTTMGGALVCLLMGLILFGIMSTFFSIPMGDLIYSCLGAFIFSLFIVYDTQMILGGKHRRIQFRENDTILAATSLYIDTINMFLFLLDFINGRN